MNTLIIEPTEDTPKVVLDSDNNIFLISNRSLPENAIIFYKPIFNWLENYMNNVNESTVFTFKLDYFNTSSAKQIIKILLLLEKIAKKGKVQIKWHYQKEDIDMKSSGNRFSKLLELDFELIELQ